MQLIRDPSRIKELQRILALQLPGSILKLKKVNKK